ncbi:MAG TPA: Gfo/Idh/MocA family oxidoreductase [Blastocatellia bacterium]|nr:Gfo/Idh/MocA family oxidoreductase [Blastocatellia bacterium]
MKSKTRREFLKKSVGAAITVNAMGGSSAKAQDANSRDKVAGANERIRVGLIGCGGQGRSDLMAMLRIKEIECVALCDVDDEQTARTLKAVKDATSQQPNLITRDFRSVIDSRDIDAVIIGTPDHWHALPTVAACQAGKDVYVEKPLSVSIGEGRVMLDTARKHDRVVQMGTQQRSAPHYMEAMEYVKGGKLGKIRLVRAWAYQDWMGNIPVVADSDPPSTVDYDFWLGPAPKRSFNKNRFHFNFRWYWDYAGGLMTDWGAHMIDVAKWGMNLNAPSSAASVGGKFGFPDDAEETPDTQQTIWTFPNFSLVWEHATAIGRGPYDRDHGVEFHGNEATLVIDRGGWEVYSETERVQWRARYRSTGVPRQFNNSQDYHFLHVKNFVDCMKDRTRPHSDVEIGHNSMIACHLGNIAFRLGRTVRWDGEKECIIGDEEAQKYVMREYRAPWSLPV